jgi:preprotein translocase SecE subunit
MGSVFAVLALAALISGLVSAGFHSRAVDFLIEVEQEMVRVEWPTFPVLVRSTLIIAVAIVVMAVLIVGVDFVNFYFLELIRWLGGKL